jgi:serine/threonine protein kinase/tetratricopeptide (TPR) repeat protein
MATDPLGTLEPGRRFGSYEILAKLGEGGMGEVYRARDLTLGRDVAIKILSRPFMADAQHLARFEREARTLASLNHPHVATIHGIEEVDGTRAIVLELVEGPTLAELITPRGIPLDRALSIARQIAEGLDAAHARGIVHRDLKPANVKVTAGAAGDHVKVLDFGLAKVGDDPDEAAVSEQPTMMATKAGTILGTTAYMSPEQARGSPVDRRTDIWAFGCVLFEMLSGTRTFEGGTMTDTLAAIIERQPKWERLPAATPPAVRHLLERCLEKDAAKRVQNIGEVRAALTQPPSSVTQSSVAPSVIRPWVMWAGAAALIVIAAFVFGRRLIERPAAPAQIRSVAVLPLADLSARSDEDYFSNGMTEELIGAMAKIRAWRVISRTSVMQYKGANKPLPSIATELGVDALVEGTVQRSNDRVRITVRLVRAGRDEENLWSQTYDRDVRDVLDLQAEVASSIADQIKLTLTPGEQQRLAVRHPVDPEVLQLYLKGKASADLGSEDAILRGIAYLDEAVRKNPGYAPAHAAMALAYGSLTPAYKAPKDVMPKSREHAVRAIELDDTLSEAHTALANVTFFYDWDWDAAEKEMRHAIDLNPSSASAHELYGNYLIAAGRKDRGIAELKVAREVNPTALTTYASLLGAYVTNGQYDVAIDEGRRAVAAHPDFAFGYGWLGMALVMKGQTAEAIPILTRARELDDNITTTHFLAMAQATAGNKAEAARLADVLAKAAENRYACAYEVGSVYLRLGDADKAVQWIRRGQEERCDCMVWLKAEPWMDPLRADPRYTDLLKRAGFPN